MKTVGEQTDGEVLSIGQRVGEFLGAVAMLVVFSFFVSHQVANTGFFTDKFGTMEMICLYGPMLLALVAPTIRVLSGRRNPSRPFDIATQLLLAIASIWLLIVFPFNFAHLAEVLPIGMRFILSWINNDVGIAIMLLQIVLCPIVALATMRKYLSVRLHEPAYPSGMGFD